MIGERGCGMKAFACREVGMNCEWKTAGRDDEEIIERIRQHARVEHGLEQVPEDLIEKVRASLAEEKAA